MTGTYHSLRSRKSAEIGLTLALACLANLVVAKSALAQSPKDCVMVSPGKPAVVHEGRYNILCIRPAPGQFSPHCTAADVTGPSRLAAFPLAIVGAETVTIAVKADGPLDLQIDGTATDAAHLFLSYDGPFDPIRDQYTLTCRW